MGKINTIWNYICRHKYFITIIIGTMLVGFVDENSVYKHVCLRMRLSELQDEIDAYQQQYERDSIKLRALTHDPKGVERIAREHYLMKRPNEDIFIMSTDAHPTSSEQKQ